MAAICPVVGTTTSVLPPNHPTYDTTDAEARCPVTNAKVAHHDSSVIHNHASTPEYPADGAAVAQDATQCPALKAANQSGSITDATCPVVGPVSAMLPPTHPKLGLKESGEVCPVTNATLGHHEGKVHQHPAVEKDAPAAKCPVAGSVLNP